MLIKGEGLFSRLLFLGIVAKYKILVVFIILSLFMVL